MNYGYTVLLNWIDSIELTKEEEFKQMKLKMNFFKIHVLNIMIFYQAVFLK